MTKIIMMNYEDDVDIVTGEDQEVKCEKTIFCVESPEIMKHRINDIYSTKGLLEYTTFKGDTVLMYIEHFSEFTIIKE